MYTIETLPPQQRKISLPQMLLLDEIGILAARTRTGRASGSDERSLVVEYFDDTDTKRFTHQKLTREPMSGALLLPSTVIEISWGDEMLFPAVFAEQRFVGEDAGYVPYDTLHYTNYPTVDRNTLSLRAVRDIVTTAQLVLPR